MGLIRQREITKREQLAVERQLFEQRASLREVKQNLPEQYKGGDEDILLNQKVGESFRRIRSFDNVDVLKPQKKKPPEIITQRAPGSQLKIPQRQDSRCSESDLILLLDVLANQEQQIQQTIDLRITEHEKWNAAWVDVTRAPLTPPREENLRSTFRTAITEYLPTPPASIVSEQSGELGVDGESPMHGKGDSIAVRYASPTYDGPQERQPSFRRRFSRGGRLMIDRRGMHVPSKEGLTEKILDRYKFDKDDDDDEMPVYHVDTYDIYSMRYRAKIAASLSHQPQQAQAVSKRPQLEASSTDTHGYAPTSSSRDHPRQHVPD